MKKINFKIQSTTREKKYQTVENSEKRLSKQASKNRIDPSLPLSVNGPRSFSVVERTQKSIAQRTLSVNGQSWKTSLTQQSLIITPVEE